MHYSIKHRKMTVLPPAICTPESEQEIFVDLIVWPPHSVGRLLAGLFVVSILACGESADTEGKRVQSDASIISATIADSSLVSEDDTPSEQATVPSSTCVLPPDCLPIELSMTMGVCCSETLVCGFDYTPVLPLYQSAVDYGLTDSIFPPDFDPEKPCVPRSSIFLELTLETIEERVAVEDGRDVLVTPDCLGREVGGIMFPGCCTPAGICGFSTHLATESLAIFVNYEDEPFTHIECVSPAEFNTQLRASTLAHLSYIPEISSSCDYAGLDARLGAKN